MAKNPTLPTTKPNYDLEFYRTRATQLDIRIFEMRALLQSGKGFSNLLNSKDLLETFMSVVRESTVCETRPSSCAMTWIQIAITTRCEHFTVCRILSSIPRAVKRRCRC